jgi:hypothetical protein
VLLLLLLLLLPLLPLLWPPGIPGGCDAKLTLISAHDFISDITFFKCKNEVHIATRFV